MKLEGRRGFGMRQWHLKSIRFWSIAPSYKREKLRPNGSTQSLKEAHLGGLPFCSFFLPFSWERETSRGMTWTRLFEARELNGVLLQEIRDDVLERSVVYIG